MTDKNKPQDGSNKKEPPVPKTPVPKTPAGDKNKTKAALKIYEYSKDGGAGANKPPRKPSATVTSTETKATENADSHVDTDEESTGLLPLNIDQHTSANDMGMRSPLDFDRLRAQREES